MEKTKFSLERTPRGLEGWLFFIGFVFAALGMIGAFIFWPSYNNGPVSYAPSIVSLSSGVIWCILFFSIGKTLEYLRKILWVLANEDEVEAVFVDAGEAHLKQKTNAEGKFGEDFPQQ